MQFDSSKCFNVSRERFVDALLAEGLSEIDIPGSTGLLNDLPLYNYPNILLPRQYEKPLEHQDDFPIASKITKSFIKFPVYSYRDEDDIMELYIRAFEKVCDYIMKEHML